MRDLTLMISTTDSRYTNLFKLLDSVSLNFNVIVIIQFNKLSVDDFDDIKIKFKIYENVKLYFLNGMGVTKSRNHALDKVNTKFAIFSDDDVLYKDNALDMVIEYFDKYPESAFLTFNVVDENNQQLKNYPKKILNHNLFSILKVGTIELAVNVEKVKDFRFPEDMGAGTEMFCCDEPVFLSKLLKKNLSGIHIPLELCIHPMQSSGKHFNKRNALTSRYVAFSRIYGKFLGTLVFFFFVIKKIKLVFGSIYFK